MRTLSLLFPCLLLALIPAKAFEVLQGADIADVRRAMKDAHYPETMLAMGSSDSDAALEMWFVDEGVFVATYSQTSHRVKSMGFVLMDERPRATRKTFDLRVIRFDTSSGRMELETQRPKR